MNYDKPPTLKEFREDFDRYVDEVGRKDDADGFLYSHKIVGGIRVDVENDDHEYEIVAIENDYLFGCGCPDGIVIRIKRIDK